MRATAFSWLPDGSCHGIITVEAPRSHPAVSTARHADNCSSHAVPLTATPANSDIPFGCCFHNAPVTSRYLLAWFQQPVPLSPAIPTFGLVQRHTACTHHHLRVVSATGEENLSCLDGSGWRVGIVLPLYTHTDSTPPATTHTAFSLHLLSHTHLPIYHAHTTPYSIHYWHLLPLSHFTHTTHTSSLFLCLRFFLHFALVAVLFGALLCLPAKKHRGPRSVGWTSPRSSSSCNMLRFALVRRGAFCCVMVFRCACAFVALHAFVSRARRMPRFRAATLPRCRFYAPCTCDILRLCACAICSLRDYPTPVSRARFSPLPSTPQTSSNMFRSRKNVVCSLLPCPHTYLLHACMPCYVLLLPLSCIYLDSLVTTAQRRLWLAAHFPAPPCMPRTPRHAVSLSLRASFVTVLKKNKHVHALYGYQHLRRLRTFALLTRTALSAHLCRWRFSSPPHHLTMNDGSRRSVKRRKGRRTDRLDRQAGRADGIGYRIEK